MALNEIELEAQKLGFIMPEGTDLISKGDDAIRRNAVKAMEYARAAWIRNESPLTAESNLDTLPAGAHIASNDSIARAVGLPDAWPGVLTVYPVGWAGALQSFTSLRGGVWQRSKVAQVWGEWSKTDNAAVTLAATAETTTLAQGAYIITNDSIARTLAMPDAWPGVLTVYPIGARGALQTFTSLRGGTWQRSKVANVWGEWATTTPEPMPRPALRRDLLQQGLRARKGGRIGTGGKGVIVIRLDDYPTETREKVIPLLKARGLPFTRVSTAVRVHEEIISQEEFTAMQEYCLDAGGEVWNHGATHGDATGQSGIYAELIEPLYTLRSKMPRLAIDCFAPPGGGRVYDGYRQGPTPESLYDTYAGQELLTHHALVSGYFDTTYYYHLDGELKDGFRFYTADPWNFSRAIRYIEYAAAWQSGVVLMWHPRLLDTAGNMSLSDFSRWLDALVAAREAGKVEVLTMSGMAVADASSTYRRDLLTKHSSTSAFSETVTFPQYRTGVPGSTVVLEANVTAAPGAHVVSEIGTSRKTTSVPSSGKLRLYHAATLPIDLAADFKVTISAPAENIHLFSA